MMFSMFPINDKIAIIYLDIIVLLKIVKNNLNQEEKVQGNKVDYRGSPHFVISVTRVTGSGLAGGGYQIGTGDPY